MQAARARRELRAAEVAAAEVEHLRASRRVLVRAAGPRGPALLCPGREAARVAVDGRREARATELREAEARLATLRAEAAEADDVFDAFVD